MQSVGRRRSLLCLFSTVLLYTASVAAVKDMKYYKTLGISEDADEQTIKKAYRKAAMKWHPDRNPDNTEKAESKFREIAAAYEVLSDPEKKQLYDQVGEEGLQQGGGAGGPGGQGGAHQFHFQGDPFEMFNSFFGGGNPFGGMGGGGMGGMGGMPGMGGGMPGMGGMPGTGGKKARKAQKHQGGGGGGDSGLYGAKSGVVKLTAANFPGKSDNQAWLLEFYAPWCGHCKQLAPVWGRVAGKLAGVVKVGAVNCDEEKELCQKHGVQGYPTIKTMARGRMQDYQGARTFSALKQAGLALLSSRALKTIAKPDQVEELLQSCGPGSKKAKWGACALLFTDKDRTAHLTRSLASQYEGNIAFGEVRGANKDLSARFNVTSYPTLLAFCNGDPAHPIPFTDAIEAAALNKFLQQFKGGKKCASAVHINENTDFEGMRVGQLKEVLKGMGAECAECAEKKDYVQRLRALVTGKTEL